MMYLYEATNQVYSSSQIAGMVGVNPEDLVGEILNSLHIYPVVKLEEKLDFFHDVDVRYEVRGQFAYELPSSVPLPLNEARSKAKLHLVKQLNERMRAIRENESLSLEAFSAALFSNSDHFEQLRRDVDSEIKAFSSKADCVEKAEDIGELRTICFGP